MQNAGTGVTKHGARLPRRSEGYKESRYMDNPHAPLYTEAPSEKGLVIFIHGFMGSPRHFDDLSEYISGQGYSAASLLLPGHGDSLKNFSSGTRAQWQGHVDAEVERLSREHKSIWLAGHSMGGLLALNTAVRFSDNIRGVFVIASPFKLAIVSAKASLTRVKMIFYRKNHPVKAAYTSHSGIKASPALLWRIAGPAVELKKLMRATSDILKDIHVPVTAVYSLSDELTSFASLEILKSGLHGTHFEQLVLSDALHDYIPEHEQAMVKQAMINMLRQPEGSGAASQQCSMYNV